MKSLFLKLLDAFDNYNVNVYYVRGHRDKQLGHSYTAVIITTADNPTDGQGLYYICETEMFFLRFKVNDRLRTRSMPISYEENISRRVLEVISQTIKAKKSIILKDPVSLAKREALRPQMTRKRSQMPAIENEQRFLVLNDRSQQTSAVA